MISPETGAFHLVSSRRFKDRPGILIRKIGKEDPRLVGLAKGMRVSEGGTVAQDAHWWILCRQGEHPEDLKRKKVKVFSEDFQSPQLNF